MPAAKIKPNEPTLALQKAATGIDGLDEITEGGLPRGRPTLVCGAAGCGKTMLAAEFLVRGAMQYGEPGVFMMFEETAAELSENMRSLGYDLGKLQRQKKISLDYVRVERSEIEETGEYDLEGLFIRLGHAIDSIGAKRVVLDTVEALFAGVPNHAILRAELRRLFRWLKDKGVTAVITGERGERSLTRYGLEEYVADCVILLDHRITDQVSTRRLRIVKYRGSSHGTNEYPFLIGSRGLSVLPITSLMNSSDESVKPTLMRLIDFLKMERTTALLTSLTTETASPLAQSEVDVSSLMDSWLLLSNVAYNGERTRTLQVLKSRGMPHSNQVREFVFGDKGVDLIDVYLAGDRVLTGTARITQAAQEAAAGELLNQDQDRRLKGLVRRRAAVDAQIAALNAEEEESRAIVNIRRLCEQLAGRCRLDIFNIADHIDRATADEVIASPTLVRVSPLPKRRFIGDLSNGGNILSALGLQAAAVTAAGASEDT